MTAGAKSKDLSLMTLNDYYAKIFLPDLSKRLKPTTINTIQSLYDNKVLPSIGNEIICTIDALKIYEWQNMLLRENLSDTYIHLIHMNLQKLFDHAIRFYRLMDENPCRTAGAIGRPRPQRKMNVLTYEEYLRIYACVKNHAMQTQIATLFWTGIRRGELYGLQWRDYDPDKKEIHIARNLVYVKKKRFYRHRKPKRVSGRLLYQTLPTSNYSNIGNTVRTKNQKHPFLSGDVEA